MSIQICPFCLIRHDFGWPPHCFKFDEDIPIAYFQKYDEIPPIWLLTVGFKEAGKTYYIGALFNQIQNMSTLWHGATYQPLDEYSRLELQNAADFSRNIKQGPTTTKDLPIPRPILIHTLGIPEFNSNCLVIFDIAGEKFQDFSKVEDKGYLGSLNAVKNLWFFVDIDEAFNINRPSKKINDLLHIYIDEMTNLGWSLDRRNIIVVYTKADL